MRFMAGPERRHPIPLSLAAAVFSAALALASCAGGGGAFASYLASEMAVAGGEGFQTRISLDGTTMAVADLNNGGEKPNAGSVALYLWENDDWAKAATLTAADGTGRDLFGYDLSLSADGNTVVVGAPGATVAGKYGVGAVYVYHRPNAGWPKGKLAQASTYTPDNQQIGTLFGFSVAVDGDGAQVAVGTWTERGNTGTVHIYKEVSTKAGETVVSMVKTNVIGYQGAQPNDFFGCSLAFSENGQRLVVGAPGRNGTKGRVVVFETGSEGWSNSSVLPLELGQLKPGDFFGYRLAVSKDANRILASSSLRGAYLLDLTANASGGLDLKSTPLPFPPDAPARVAAGGVPQLAMSQDGAVGAFCLPASRSYAAPGMLFRMDEKSLDAATIKTESMKKTVTGLAFSADGTRFAAGDGGAHKGRGEFWTQKIARDPAAAAKSARYAEDVQERGAALGLSANGAVLIYGGPSLHETGAASGGAVVFEYNREKNIWKFAGVLADKNAKAGDRIGQCLEATPDASTIVLGAPAANGGAGAAYVFVKPADGWKPMNEAAAVLVRNNGAPGDAFGSALAVSADGSTVFAGSPGADNGIGSVDVFAMPAGGWKSGAPKSASLKFGAQAGGHYGSALALSKDGAVLAVGAPDRGFGELDLIQKPKEGWMDGKSFTVSATTLNAQDGKGGFSALAINAAGTTVVTALEGPKPGTLRTLVLQAQAKGGFAQTTLDTNLPAAFADGRKGVALDLNADATLLAVSCTGNYGTGAVVFLKSEKANLSGKIASVTQSQKRPWKYGASVALSADGTMAAVGEPGYAGGLGDFETLDVPTMFK